MIDLKLNCDICGGCIAISTYTNAESLYNLERDVRGVTVEDIYEHVCQECYNALNRKMIDLKTQSNTNTDD